MSPLYKLLSGLAVVAAGLLMPGLLDADLVTNLPLQGINAVSIAAIAIILVCCRTSAFVGAAGAYLLLLSVIYGSMAAGRRDAQEGITICFLHVLYAPLSVAVGTALGYAAGSLTHFKERRGFPVEPTAPTRD